MVGNSVHASFLIQNVERKTRGYNNFSLAVAVLIHYELFYEEILGKKHVHSIRFTS